ncbi:MAG: NAD(P)H-hydrate dehydratase [Spirochaetes bacterium]|nr:NAD(P)H-hydrate dehydratase [Spirochaetota bacterium]
MKIAKADQMQKIDKQAVTDYGIPEIDLMENAGRCVAFDIMNDWGRDVTIGIVCGHGNNGGDGFVCARILHLYDYAVMIFFTGNREKLTPSAAINFKLCLKREIPFIDINAESNFKKNKSRFRACDLFIDAMLGTGLNSPLKGNLKTIVEYINSLKRPVWSVDIPTGIFSDTSQVTLPVIKATRTITFGLPKISQILSPARQYAGSLKVADIGFPAELLKKGIDLDLATRELSCYLPQRPVEAHKGDFGHVLIYGGSLGKSGAAIMASRAALKAGAGLVTTICPREINLILESSLVEPMTLPVDLDLDGTKGALKKVAPLLKKADVIATGCGIGTENKVKAFLSELLKTKGKVFVLDADALNIIASSPNLLNNRSSHFILTPHLGEMSRLVKKDIKYIIKDRIGIARQFAKQKNCTLALKSSETIVASARGEIYICNNGNAGMATAGSGDVLTGLIAGIVAQNIKQGRSLFHSVVLACYLHALSGQVACHKKTSYSLVATDLIDNVGEAFKWLMTSGPEK